MLRNYEPLEPNFYEMIFYYILPTLVVVALAVFAVKAYKNSKKPSKGQNAEGFNPIDR